MTLHSLIGILVAIAVPLWLVVEQVLLTWRVLEPRRLPSRARTETVHQSKAAIADRHRDVTGPVLHRKAS